MFGEPFYFLAAQVRMNPTITAIVLTGNSARLLERCLASVAFCDELIVVDSLSRDESVAIAQRHGARVYERAWEGIGRQFAFALEKVTTDFVFILDSDEICPPDLQKEIKGVLAQAGRGETGEIGGWFIPRRSWYFDRFLEHSGWRPDLLLRLFKKGGATIAMSGAHQTFVPAGKTGRLTADIIHYPYAGFANQLEKLNDYAERGAATLRARGARGGVLAGLGHGLGRFCKLYFVKQGFRDGRAGFINATHGAMYAYLKYVRVLEASWGAPYDGQDGKKGAGHGE